MKRNKLCAFILALIMVGMLLSGCDDKCDVCHGSGYYQKKTCIFCSGTGKD